ncbi:hypothetical protein BB559_004364 [Furculomyces boomerangus]|uniref:Uncharacterized protein n=2 Tax=Harpellales TaxID=61421 RepID=A0A2T9YF26_9FUNG|nr:hypothetical protein BB559_004364 [Furculomyces boomerangus]PVZ97602.1 hypothetical protein BB558_006433 [Smittium angustum]
MTFGFSFMKHFGSKTENIQIDNNGIITKDSNPQEKNKTPQDSSKNSLNDPSLMISQEINNLSFNDKKSISPSQKQKSAPPTSQITLQKSNLDIDKDEVDLNPTVLEKKYTNFLTSDHTINGHWNDPPKSVFSRTSSGATRNGKSKTGGGPSKHKYIGLPNYINDPTPSVSDSAENPGSGTTTPRNLSLPPVSSASNINGMRDSSNKSTELPTKNNSTINLDSGVSASSTPAPPTQPSAPSKKKTQESFDNELVIVEKDSEIKNDGNSSSDQNVDLKEVTIMDVVQKLYHILDSTNPESTVAERTIQDTRKRIEYLEQRMNTLPEQVTQNLYLVLKAINENENDKALSIHRDLVKMSLESETKWIVGLKRVIEYNKKLVS